MPQSRTADSKDTDCQVMWGFGDCGYLLLLELTFTIDLNRLLQKIQSITD